MAGNFQVPIKHLHYDQMYQSEGARSVDIQAPGSDVYIYPKCKAELLQDVC